jgi:tetratricopeptide (TPR) repeat protein
MMLPFLHWLPVLLGAAGSPDTTRLPLLRRQAEDLLRAGKPASALVVLQKARSMDSLQMGIDNLMNRCRAELGGWVAEGTGSDWMDAGDASNRAATRNPDSVFRVAKRLAEAGNLPASVQLLQILSRLPNADPAYLRTYTELRKRQSDLVAFHANLADQARRRGAIDECLDERRQAFGARPDDPLLASQTAEAEQESAVSALAFRSALRRSLSVSDNSGALAILARARIAHPGDPEFRSVQDSLLAKRKDQLGSRIAEIGRMVDSGRVQAAEEALDGLRADYPSDSGVSKARGALRSRIDARNRKLAVDSASAPFLQVLEQGDLEAAGAMLDGLRARGVAGEDLTRLSRKLDSTRNRQRSAAQFDQALANARKALARGDTTAARTWTAKALEIRPDNALARGIQSALAAVRPKAPGVQPPLAAASRKQPQKVESLVASGIDAYRNGDYTAAMDRWKEALAIDPDCVQAQRYLQNVQRKQERLK